MKDAAKQFLDRRMTRRAFASRLAQIGLAPAAAAGMAQALSAATLTAPESPGRVARDLTGGELMAEFLLDWNVKYLFGLGGSEEVGFLDALVDRVALHYVQGLHEGSVMSMADGYARASGETAFVNVHSVAGTAYALGPMTNAFKDRTPIVVTAGRQSRSIRGQNAFLESDNLEQLPRPYTQWSWDVLTAESIPEVLRRAFLLAQVPPGGPTFVTVSKDLWEARVAQAEILPRSRSEIESTVHPDPDIVARVVDRLVGAGLPVIVAGHELGRYGGGEEVREIAEVLGAPVFADLFASHGPITFASKHPLYAGYFAEDPRFPKDFDLFWSVGGTMFTVGAPSPEPLVPREATIVHTALDATALGRTYPVDLPMPANPKLAARAVLDELRRRSLSSSTIEARRRRVREYTDGRRRSFDDQARQSWDHAPIMCERLSVELDRRMDPRAIVVTELISEEQLANAYFTFDQEGGGRRHLTTSGGCLGWGLPAAVGAKIGRPDRQVVALVGDGSFQFGVQALWSAVRYEIPVAVIIWNNSAYQANRKFLHLYGGRAAETGKYIGCSLDSPAIDHVGICRAYGVESERVDAPAALGAALDRCFRAVDEGRPYVLDVTVQRRWGGAASTWYDHFSVAKGQARQS